MQTTVCCLNGDPWDWPSLHLAVAPVGAGSELCGLQTAGWVAPSVPMSARDQLGTACRRLFFRSAWTHQLLSHQLTRQLGSGRNLGGPQSLTWLLGCCRLCHHQAPAPCFLCQIPGSPIWGGLELLCTALHLPSLAPAAQAGIGDLAHVKGNKTWEGTR